MRKAIFLLMALVFLAGLISAELVITEQPKEIYNLGDTIKIPMKIVTLGDLSELFTINLICNGIETEVYREYVFLSSGEEIKREPSIPLIKSFTGRTTGTCKIKASLGQEIYLTNEFVISDLIKVELKNIQTTAKPGEEVAVEISAIKENEKAVSGILEVNVVGDSIENMNIIDTVKNGYGYIVFTFLAGTPAKEYSVRVNVSEKDFQGEITNRGSAEYRISVSQVPTSLEILMENQNVEPDTSAKIKPVLHDQTGESITSTATVTLKNTKGLVVEQTETITDEFFDFPIIYKEPVGQWTVLAESNNLTAELSFTIPENPKISTLVINKTLVITNMGNVYYNNSVAVRIENSTLEINVSLGIDESSKYLLSAPNGEYKVQIMTGEGGSETIEGVALTGKSISVKEASEGVIKFVSHPISWIFIILVLGFVSFIVFKKGYKRSFFGKINIPLKGFSSKNSDSPKRNSIINPHNRAEISLSIKGDKQDISIVCLKIKNIESLKYKKGQASANLARVIDFAEKNKAFVYENLQDIFFLLAPAVTRTFSNEKAAIEIAQNIQAVLTEHNKMFNDKIEFGIGINHGTIVAKKEDEVLKFMSMGTLITNAKKLAFSEEISLGEKIKDRLGASIKTEKHEKDGMVYFTIKEIKDREEHKKFIRSFLDRIEGKK